MHLTISLHSERLLFVCPREKTTGQKSNPIYLTRHEISTRNSCVYTLSPSWHGVIPLTQSQGDLLRSRWMDFVPECFFSTATAVDTGCGVSFVLAVGNRQTANEKGFPNRITRSTGNVIVRPGGVKEWT